MTSSTSTTRQINRTIRQDPRWAAILARDPAADGTLEFKLQLTPA